MATGSKPKLVISPPSLLTWPGLVTNFSLQVDNKPASAEWSISPLATGVGTIDAKTGQFKAYDEYRNPTATVTAKVTIDGQPYVRQARVRSMLGKGLMQSSGEPYLADSFGPIPCARWDDIHGYRAAKLMWDALDQLPAQFKNSVGEVAIVRVKGLGDKIEGMHLPLPKRVILIADEYVSALPVDGPINLSDDDDHSDKSFVRTFIHEMSHCALCNTAIPDVERWWLIIYLAFAARELFKADLIPILLAFPLLMLQFYVLHPSDALTDYAKATGWTINDPSLAMMFRKSGSRITPNAITGHQFLKRVVGLRNIYTFHNPQDLQSVGMYSPYSLTDVHEDFATAFAALALGDDYTGDKSYASRLDYIVAKHYWPKDDPDPSKRKWKVVPGSVPGRWARANGLPDPPFGDWGIWMGLYAGPRSENKAFPAATAPDAARMAAFAANAEDNGDVVVEEPAMGDGYAQPSDADDLKGALDAVQAADQVEQANTAFAEKAGPVVDGVQQTVASMAVPFEDGSVLDVLRTADCHGDGVVPLQRVEVPFGVSYPGGTHVGDLLIASDLSFWIATSVREDGCVAEMTGAPTIDPETLDFKAKALNLNYAWRPTPTLRTWWKDQSPPDQAAMVKITRLWGVETAPSGRKLHQPGAFLTEIAAAFGVSLSGLDDASDDDVMNYARAHGLKAFLATAPDPQPGDIVLCKNALWGVALGSNPLKLLVQAGKDDGEFGEDQWAAKVHSTTGVQTVSQIMPLEAFRKS